MPKKILVVDDSSTMRQQVAQALKEAGYVIVEAGDGVEGLQKIADDPEIAVLIVDVNMPRMNGIEMIENYKVQGGNSDKPVIMLTREGELSLIERA